MLRGITQMRNGNILVWGDYYQIRDINGNLLSTLSGFPYADTKIFILSDGRIAGFAPSQLILWDEDGQLLESAEDIDYNPSGVSELSNGHLIIWGSKKCSQIRGFNLELITELCHEHYLIGTRQLDNGNILTWSADTTLRLWTIDGLLLATMGIPQLPT